MTLRRDERLRRQRFDTGDDGDEVWINRVGDSSTVYHDDEGCASTCTQRTPGVDESGAVVDPVTRKEAQLKWLAPCSLCTIDGPPADDAEPPRLA